ncbi:MAG: LemA family protein [Burkholderiaceae bacterium]
MNPDAMAWTAAIALGGVLLAAGVLAYAVALYNGLVQVRHQVDQAWANIDVLLRQRHDELPALIGAVAGHAAYERALLERVTTLRAQVSAGGADVPGRLASEQMLSSGVVQLLAVAENQPTLHADASFRKLQARASALESQIAQRRNFYNEAVSLNNVRRESFPDRLFAPLARLVQRPLFTADEPDRADVDIEIRAG